MQAAAVLQMRERQKFRGASIVGTLPCAELFLRFLDEELAPKEELELEGCPAVKAGVKLNSSELSLKATLSHSLEREWVNMKCSA